MKQGFRKSNKYSRSNGRIGFIADQGGFRYLNFTEFADHVAWRIAHFLDDRRIGGKTGGLDFINYMSATGILVSVDNVGETPNLLFSDNQFLGFTLHEAQVSPEASYTSLSEQFLEFDEYRINQINGAPERPIPFAEQDAQPSWYYTPTDQEISERSKVLKASKGQFGILGEYKPKGATRNNPYNAILGSKLTARKRVDGKYADVSYSKTYFAQDDGTFTKETNTKASFYRYESVVAPTVSAYLDEIYDGGCAIHGKHVFLDGGYGFFGRRTIKPQVERENTEDKFGRFRSVKLKVKKSFIEQFPGQKELADTAQFETINMPTIVPTPRKVFAIDVDKLQTPEGFDIINKRDDAIAFIRSRLPHSLKQAEMVVMLSSSFGVVADENDNHRLDTKSDNISCRLWFESSKPMMPADFGGLVEHFQEGLASDIGIYSANQAIYGNPNFIRDGEEMPDPYILHRRFIAPGDRSFDVDAFLAEKTEKDAARKQRDIEMMKAAGMNSNSNSVAELLNLDTNLTGLSRSREMTVKKLNHLGDRAMMAKFSKDGSHWSFLRNVVNGHINSVFNEMPDTRPATVADLRDTSRTDLLSQEIQFLSVVVSQKFVEAAQDPDRVTTLNDMSGYGVKSEGVLPEGKIGQMMLDASREISNAQRNKRNAIRRSLIAQAETGKGVDADLIQNYLDKYTYQTEIVGGDSELRKEAFTGANVLVSPKGIYIDDPDLKQKLLTYDGADEFVWVPVSDPTRLPDFWKSGSVDEVVAGFENRFGIQNRVFLHNVEVFQVKNELPQRVAMKSAFGSKSAETATERNDLKSRVQEGATPAKKSESGDTNIVASQINITIPSFLR